MPNLDRRTLLAGAGVTAAAALGTAGVATAAASTSPTAATTPTPATGGSVAASAIALGIRTPHPPRRQETGIVWDMRTLRGYATGDHNGFIPPDGAIQAFGGTHFENPNTKLEAYNLAEAVGLIEQLHRIRTRQATRPELLLNHTSAMLAEVERVSGLEIGGLIDGHDTRLPHNGHLLAGLTAGGAIDLALAVWKGSVRNGYLLMRPPGHHALPDRSMGFCIYNNVALAAKALLKQGAKRILIVDWDVHTGNGTQKSFEGDPRVVIVDMHQRECFPPGEGHIERRGVGNIINVDLPPGSGHATALDVADRVIGPAIRRHNPEITLIASGYDCGVTDPLARQLFGPSTFGELTARVMAAADNPTCQGRIMMTHEGGYDERVVPEYVLAVLGQLSGIEIARPYQFEGYAVQQQLGITPEILAVHRQIVGRAAALVSELPRH